MPNYAPHPVNVARRRRRVVLAVFVIGLAAAILLGGPTAERLTGAIRDLARTGSGAPRAAVYLAGALFSFAAAALPLPIEAPAFLNGTLFPPVQAFWLTWFAVLAGCTASYELGRRLGHGLATRLVGAERMARVEGLIARAGWPTLLALRLSPVMAFTALNWASGVLALSRPVFYWTTAVGITPGTFVFTVAPGLLSRGGSAALLIGLGFAVAVGLLAMSYLRVRRRPA